MLIGTGFSSRVLLKQKKPAFADFPSPLRGAAGSSRYRNAYRDRLLLPDFVKTKKSLHSQTIHLHFAELPGVPDIAMLIGTGFSSRVLLEQKKPAFADFPSPLRGAAGSRTRVQISNP